MTPDRVDRSILILDETAASLPAYGTIRIAFNVLSVFRVSQNPDGERVLTEVTAAPYLKDYDEFPEETPKQWPKRFDVGNWGFFAAFADERRVGGAAVAWNTPGVHMLEGRSNLACLWDIRVDPEFRGAGIGYKLFQHAATWAKKRGCTQLKIETQNVNVPACKFYAKQNCILREVNFDVYPPEFDEVQMLWYLDL